ncbi:hypothetical protein ACU4GD_31795 [Cupriavidus basilensis]
MTADHKGSLAVYQAQGAYETGERYVQQRQATSRPADDRRSRFGQPHHRGRHHQRVGAGRAGPHRRCRPSTLGPNWPYRHAQRSGTTVVLPSGKLTLSADND